MIKTLTQQYKQYRRFVAANNRYYDIDSTVYPSRSAVFDAAARSARKTAQFEYDKAIEIGVPKWLIGERPV